MNSIPQDWVFCPPLLGKPDPKQLRPLNGPDTRRRVIQKGHVNRAWYDCINLLRDRWKAPNTERLQERQFEKLVSSKYKKLAQFREEHLFIHALHIPVFKQLVSINRKDLTDQHTNAFAFLEKTLQIKLLPFVEEFKIQNNYDQLCNYLQSLYDSKLTELNKAFVADLQNLITPISISLDVAPQRVEAVLRYLCSEYYGLRASSWNPRTFFENFISELKKNGPLMVTGFFGLAAYKALPKKTNDQMNQRPIYRWPPDSHHDFLQGVSTVILLVGAKKFPTENIVYFIDPTEGSDPAQPEQQKIYAMAYETLTNLENIADNYNQYGLELASPDVGYAFYKPTPTATS